MVCIKADRGMFTLKFKTKHTDNEYQEMDFLCKKNMKSKGIPNPIGKTKLCGVSKEKTDSILNNINQILPENRKIFWENLNHL